MRTKDRPAEDRQITVYNEASLMHLPVEVEQTYIDIYLMSNMCNHDTLDYIYGRYDNGNYTLSFIASSIDFIVIRVEDEGY